MWGVDVEKNYRLIDIVNVEGMTKRVCVSEVNENAC